MKIYFTTTLLALAGFAASSASAATTAYSADDLMLGFRKVGAANDYLVDLGQVSLYKNTSSFTLSIAGVDADLSALFGAGWKNDPNVFWGLVATPGVTAAGGDAANVLYASKPESVFGVQETPYLRDTSSSQGIARTGINTLGSNYAQNTSTANNPAGLIQSSADAASWAAFNPGGLSFSYFAGLEGNFGNGTAGTQLDLFRMAPQTPALGTPGTYAGSFTLSDSGVLNYNSTPLQLVPVPEPTSAMAIGAAATIVALVRRRRVALA